MNFNFIGWRSLKTRVTLFTLAIFLISIWSLAFYADRILREELERQLGEQQFSTVSFVADEINEELGERVLALERDARLIDQTMLSNPASLQQMFEKHPILLDHFNGGLLVLLLDGTAVADVPARAGRRGVNYYDNEADHIALTEGKAAISGPMMGRKLKQALFNIAVPIHDAQGKVIGALVGIINLALPNFLDSIQNHRYGKSGGYLVIDPKHNLVVSATDKTRVMQPVPAPGINQLFDKRAQGFDGPKVAVNPLGVENLSSSARVPVAGWFVVAALPMQEAFAPIHRTEQHIIVATIFLTLLAGSLTWWMLRRELLPLVSTANRLATQAEAKLLPQPLSLTRQDETNQLISGFNRLLQTLAQREETLQESEARYREMFQSNPQPMWVYDFESLAFLAVNDAAVARYGYSREEFLNMTIGDIRPTEELPRFLDSASYVPPGLNDAGLWQHRRKDGSIILVEIHSHSLLFGGHDARVVMAHDVTARKRAEEALRKTNIELTLFRNLIDHANDAIMIVDPVTTRLTDANDTLSRMLGYSKEELLGMTPINFHPDNGADTASMIEEPLKTSGSAHLEAVYRRKDGTTFPVEINVNLVQLDKPYAVTVISDITERKQIQAKISRLNTELEERVLARTAELHQVNRSLSRAKIRAEAANIAKSTFLANMSHEIRTPLNAILGFSKLIRHDPDASDKLRKTIDIICRSGEHLLTLINDVLDMAKIDAGRMVIAKTSFDLTELVDETTNMMRVRAEGKGLPLTLTQSSRLPHFVSTDASKLRQILINLIGNAIKFTEHGGVTLRLNAAPGKESQQLLSIEVEDSGIGISAADQGEIFEPFVQAGHKKQRGTGLGLAITRRFVQLMGGSISVQSAIGKGSLFRVELPIELAQAPEPDAVELKPGRVVGLAPGQSDYRILIVEDQLENSLLLAEILDLPGLQVRVATNGEQGVEMFTQCKPHLMWMDIRMPVMDGLEATRRIRAQPGGQEVKIVAVTASVFKEEHDSLMAAGMDATVRKPYQFEEIYQALTTLLGISFVYEET